MNWLRDLFKPDPKLHRDKPPERAMRKDVYQHPDFTDHIEDLKSTVRSLNIDTERLEKEAWHPFVNKVGLPLSHWRKLNGKEQDE